MKCERCNKNEANFYYEENINGHTRSVHLCRECAAQLQAGSALFQEGASHISFPFTQHTGNNILDGLFGISASTAPPKSQTACPGCHATWNDLMKAGKAFCPQCYTTFGEELKPTVRSLHGNVTHVGRAPAGRRAQREKRDRLTALRTRLATAIAEERFEEAATLRDEIRALEQE